MKCGHVTEPGIGTRCDEDAEFQINWQKWGYKSPEEPQEWVAKDQLPLFRCVSHVAASVALITTSRGIFYRLVSVTEPVEQRESHP